MKCLNVISKLAPATILVVAMGVVFLFYVGIGLEESLQVSETARGINKLDFDQEFWQSLEQLRASVGMRSILLALPLSFLYSIGGVNEITTELIPVLSALANVFMVYLLARNLYGKKAAWLAGFLFVALPTTLFTATAYPFTQLAVAFSLGLVLIYNRKEVANGKLRLPGMILLGIVLIILDSVLAFCLLALVSTFQILESNRPRLAWLPVMLIGASLMVGSGGNIGGVFVAFYDGLVRLPEMEVLLPAVIVVITLTLRKVTSKDYLPLALFIVSFIGLLWRFSTYGELLLIADPLFSLLLLAPVLLMSSLFSKGQNLSENHMAPVLTPFAFLGLSWLAVSGQKLLIPSYSEFDWISLQALIPALRILPGPVFLLFVAYALFLVTGKTKPARTISVLLPFLLAAALIPINWQRWHDHRPSILAARQANELLMEAGTGLPAYVIDDTRLVKQLEYLWNDEYPGRLEALELQEVMGKVERGRGGYILYWEDDIQNPPVNWWQMGSFGALGQRRLVVARALDEIEALRILEESSAVPRSNEELNWPYGAAANANRPCLAISMWIESQRSVAGTPDYFPLFDFPMEECFQVSESENLIAGQPPILYPRHIRIQYSGERRTLQEGAAIGRKYPFFEDPRVFYLEISLEPNSIYVYHVELRGVENLMPLYWKIGDYENYLDYGLYRGWTPLTILFSTYGWEEGPLKATLSPFMYYGTYYGGSVELRDLQLFELNLDNQAE